MNKAIKRIAMLFMVCGLAVSVSFAYELDLIQKSGEEYVKKAVAELERVKKQTYNNYIGAQGKQTLLEGKDFLEFVEKVKQSPKKDCLYAVRDVMSDSGNNDKYHYYVWSESMRQTEGGCMDLRGFVRQVKEIKEWLNKRGIKHNLP